MSEPNLPPLLTDDEIAGIVRSVPARPFRPMSGEPTSVRLARAVEQRVRAAIEADRAERSLSGDSAAGVGVTNPFVLHAVGTLREEIERLRDLLREALPELLGENWQEARYCTHCRSYDGHTDGCLITRIEREVT